MTEKTLSNADIGDLQKAVRDMQSNLHRGLNFRPIDQHPTYLRVYTDASLASNNDLISQLGYLISPSESDNLVNVIDFASLNGKEFSGQLWKESCTPSRMCLIVL